MRYRQIFRSHTSHKMIGLGIMKDIPEGGRIKDAWTHNGIQEKKGESQEITDEHTREKRNDFFPHPMQNEKNYEDLCEEHKIGVFQDRKEKGRLEKREKTDFIHRSAEDPTVKGEIGLHQCRIVQTIYGESGEKVIRVPYGPVAEEKDQDISGEESREPRFDVKAIPYDDDDHEKAGELEKRAIHAVRNGQRHSDEYSNRSDETGRQRKPCFQEKNRFCHSVGIRNDHKRYRQQEVPGNNGTESD